MAQGHSMDPGHSAYLLWADSIEVCHLAASVCRPSVQVRDSLMGAVYKVGDEFLMLSQRSMHYFRRIAELVLAPVLADDHVHIGVATAGRVVCEGCDETYRTGKMSSRPANLCCFEFRTYTSRTIAP